MRRVHSRVLGEEVVFARDGADVPADMPGIVYRESELQQLAGCSPERLRAIHAVKREFDGELIDDPGEEWIVPVEALLPGKRVEPDACPTCGKTNWWTKRSGQRVCSICHPDPRRLERG